VTLSDKQKEATSLDDVESKIPFGRYIERTAGIKIFRHPATEATHR